MRLLLATMLGASALALAACMATPAVAPMPVALKPMAAPAPPTPAPDPAALARAETAKLTAFLDRQFEASLALNPQSYAGQGRKDKNDQLNDLTAAHDAEMLAWRQKSVASMNSQFDRARLSADGQLNYDLWAYTLVRAERQAKFQTQAYVFGYNSAPHSGLPNFMISNHRVDDVSDMVAYNRRLSLIATALDQSIARAKAAAAAGVRVPKFQYERIIKESADLVSGQPFTTKGKDSPLWADAKKKIKALGDAGKASPEQVKALTDGAREALVGSMKPGYERLIAWAKADARHAPSGKVGSITLPDGANAYAASLFDQTTTDMTAEEIHKLGLSEVARIHGEMDKLAQTAGFKDRKAFLADRAKKKDLVLPPTDTGRAEYLKIANADVANARAALPNWFGELPKYPMEVQREPAFSEVAGGAAHASRATPNGSKPGVVFVHLLTPTGFLRSEIADLMCHEGVPGHLLQGDIMVRQSGGPKFRTAYAYAAYNEGWGLYAEGLCKEMGIYTDVYSDYSRLDGELWRAVRLVVDTGLHAQGWSEAEAEKYARENTSEPDTKIQAEVRRFIVNPGQACAYKIGQLTILRLRGEAEKALGPKFDIKAFHDLVVGGGSLPLPVLEVRVRTWIAAQKA
jgi:uncharacterized protein (DUF885 family)